MYSNVNTNTRGMPRRVVVPSKSIVSNVSQIVFLLLLVPNHEINLYNTYRCNNVYN